jgi:hypothetical protein
VIYLDNILIFSENPAKYIKTIREVLNFFIFFVNLKKYNFGINTIEFLGFIIRPNGTEIDLSYI